MSSRGHDWYQQVESVRETADITHPHGVQLTLEGTMARRSLVGSYRGDDDE